MKLSLTYIIVTVAYLSGLVDHDLNCNCTEIFCTSPSSFIPVRVLLYSCRSPSHTIQAKAALSTDAQNAHSLRFPLLNPSITRFFSFYFCFLGPVMCFDIRAKW